MSSVINKSFKEAKVPHQLKRANVSPIIKNKDLDPDNLKNYRPISNIPFIAKVLEKAVFYQVNEHLQKHGLYSLNQSGYRENHSCETTLLKIVDDMQKTIHIDNLSAVLMLDLSAAFDTVNQGFPNQGSRPQVGSEWSIHGITNWSWGRWGR